MLWDAKGQEIPDPQQWWVDGFYSVKIKRGICSCIFFFASKPADRKREWGRGCCHQHCGPVLCCERGSKAAQHPPWKMHITADADFVILQCRSVCHCMFIFVCLCAHTVHVPVNRQHVSCAGVTIQHFFLLPLLIQSHLPCFRQSLPRRNKDVFFHATEHTWLTVNLHLCPICAHMSVQSFDLNQH